MDAFLVRLSTSSPTRVLSLPFSAHGHAIARRVWGILIALCVIIIVLPLNGDRSLQHLGALKSHIGHYLPSEASSMFCSSPVEVETMAFCDPSQQPGYVDHITFHWRTFNPDCPGTDYNATFASLKGEELRQAVPELVDKSMLFIGDSVGKNAFDKLCALDGFAPVERKWAPGSEDVIYWDSLTCQHPDLNFKVASIHVYTNVDTQKQEILQLMDDFWSYNLGNGFVFEDRIERWFNTTLQDFKPDFIQLNSGAWDYKYWLYRDLLEGRVHEDIPDDDIQDLALTTVRHLDYLGDKFPQASLWFQHQRYFGETDLYIREAAYQHVRSQHRGKEMRELPHFYTIRRQAKHKALLEYAVAAAGYESLDYGKIQRSITAQLFDVTNGRDKTHWGEQAKQAMASMILGHIQFKVRQQARS